MLVWSCIGELGCTTKGLYIKRIQQLDELGGELLEPFTAPGGTHLVPLAKALSLTEKLFFAQDRSILDLKACPETGKTLRPPKNLQRHIVFQWG